MLRDVLLAFGRGRVGSFERELQRADQASKLAKPAITESKILPVDDVDLVTLDDGGLVDGFQVIFAEIGLKRDIDRLGQVLQRRLDADLFGVYIKGHVAQTAGFSRSDGSRVTGSGGDC